MSTGERPGVQRRSFLKGVTAAGAAAVGGGLLGSAPVSAMAGGSSGPDKGGARRGPVTATTAAGTSLGRAQGQAEPAPRPIADVRENMLERARALRNPFTYTRYEEVEAAFARLDSLDRDQWAAAFSAFAPPYEARAAEAEAAGDSAAARENYLIAYDYYHIARYTAPNSPGKLAAYRKSQENYLKAARYFDPPLEAVEMPFQGRAGEGQAVPGHLRKPAGASTAALPVVVLWGGIDSFKEDRPVQQYLDAGLATLSIDMPGVADSPVAGSEDAERSFDAIFDWIATRPDLDAARVGLHGGSTGGYWATKVAHTHRERVRAAINQGGPAHFAFEPDWIAKAQYGEYPFELAETLAYAFGRATYQEWVDYAPRLSLVRQGVLDQPCAPLLLVNGINDSVFPVQDMYVLLEHGGVKEARLFVAGHMGNTPQTQPVLTRWLVEHLTS